jgi:hypothetical protein
MGWRCGFALQRDKSGFWAGSGVVRIAWKVQGGGALVAAVRYMPGSGSGAGSGTMASQYNANYCTGWFGAGSLTLWLVIAVA